MNPDRGGGLRWKRGLSRMQRASIPQQYETVARTVPHLVDLIAKGWRLLSIARQWASGRLHPCGGSGDLTQDEVDPVPVDYAVADTQGALATCSSKAAFNELARG